MRYDNIWPYHDIHDLLWCAWVQFIFMFAICVVTYVVVFVIPSPKKAWLKTTTDIILAFILFIAEMLFISRILHVKVEWGGTAFNAIFTFLAMETAFFIGRYNNALRKEARTKQEIAQYQYDLLKSQVNPHFLFNSLNILGSLVASNSDQSYWFITSLATIYRYVLSWEGKERVSLQEELIFLNHLSAY